LGWTERAENKRKLYIRLAPGQSLQNTKIEVSTRRQAFRFDGGDRDAPKNNLVLRGLSFQHFASRTKEWGDESTIALGNKARNILD
jgi:hypothetical protein